MPRGRRKTELGAGSGFEARLLAYVRTHHGDRAAARAQGFRLASEREVCRYLELLLTFGKDFDTPGGRVAAALADPSKPASKRLDLAFERAWKARGGAVKQRIRQAFTDRLASLEPLPVAAVRGAALS